MNRKTNWDTALKLFPNDESKRRRYMLYCIRTEEIEQLEKELDNKCRQRRELINELDLNKQEITK